MNRVAHQAGSRPNSCVHESRMLYVPEGVLAKTASRKDVQANHPQVVMRKEPMTMMDLKCVSRILNVVSALLPQSMIGGGPYMSFQFMYKTPAVKVRVPSAWRPGSRTPVLAHP